VIQAGCHCIWFACSLGFACVTDENLLKSLLRVFHLFFHLTFLRTVSLLALFFVFPLLTQLVSNIALLFADLLFFLLAAFLEGLNLKEFFGHVLFSLESLAHAVSD
jgi:hypothetical protein